ncbi:MAG: galactose mutarotase [Bacteroidales bacterium]|nr:galactose mutarotase [Bacteroidales bacterium]
MKTSISLLRFLPCILGLFWATTNLSAQDEIHAVTLRHPATGIEMTAINYGARIVSLKPYGIDVVLGYDKLSDYVETRQNFGAVVGRYIGRIIQGHLEIDGITYELQKQGSGDCGHGGNPNFGARYWNITASTDTTVTMRYISPDGENGFPGELTLDVTYTLLPDALRIDYLATTSKPTVLNPCNHSFFNLSGDLGCDVLDEALWIDSDSIALYDENKRVYGKLGAVADTPFDFNEPISIGYRIDDDNFQLGVTGGYDHCYQLNNYLRNKQHSCSGECCNNKCNDEALLRAPVAWLHDNETGLTMQVYTTEPAMQIYTANGHKGNLIGKEGKPYNRRNAICFETMHFPDSPNQPHWPSTLLRPGETFRSTTIYKFLKD